jgi:hypothetical protein
LEWHSDLPFPQDIEKILLGVLCGEKLMALLAGVNVWVTTSELGLEIGGDLWYHIEHKRMRRIIVALTAAVVD